MQNVPNLEFLSIKNTLPQDNSKCDYDLDTEMSETVISLVTLLPTLKVCLKPKSTTCTALLKHSTNDSRIIYLPDSGLFTPRM